MAFLPAPSSTKSSSVHRCDGRSVPGSTSRSRALLRLAAALPSLTCFPALAIQPRQAEALVEKLVTGLTTQKVLDKITTVITSQTTVEPEDLIKAVTENEPEDAWEAFRSGVFDLWTSTADFVLHFDPAALARGTGELLGEFAETFASWELSSLAALVERWLIWTPIVILPMAWQMRSKQQQNARQRLQEELQLSECARLKQEQVYRELQRIQLRAELLNCLKSSSDRHRVEELARKLSTMTIGEEQPGAVDGRWQLLYSTQTPGSNLLPGLEIGNLRQHLVLLHKEEEELQQQQLQRKPDAAVQNMATIRLGPLGAIEVTLQATWEHLGSTNSSASLLVGGIKVQLLEMLGTPVGVELPGIHIELPESLRQTMQWKLLYVDDQMRIDEASESRLYVFIKSD